MTETGHAAHSPDYKSAHPYEGFPWPPPTIGDYRKLRDRIAHLEEAIRKHREAFAWHGHVPHAADKRLWQQAEMEK